MKVELRHVTPLNIMSEAARTCYDSVGDDGGEKDKALLEKIAKLGHTSVVEHTTFSFKIEGVSRSLSHQLVRHRIASYSQRSQRYVKEKQFDYTIPDTVSNNPDAHHLYEDMMAVIQDAYDRLCAMGVPKEDARYVLPNACHTELFMTINMRSLINLLNLRLDKHAQWEIRTMARMMFDAIPQDYKDIILVCISEGLIN